MRSPSSGGLSLACWSRPPFAEVPKCGWSDRCTLGLLLSKKTSSHTARYKSSGRDSGRDSRVTPFWQQAWGLPAGLSRDSRVEDSRIDPFWQQAWGLPAGSLRVSRTDSCVAMRIISPWQQAWGLPEGNFRTERSWQQARGLPEGSSLTQANAVKALDVGVGRKSPNIA